MKTQDLLCGAIQQIRDGLKKAGAELTTPLRIHLDFGSTVDKTGKLYLPDPEACTLSVTAEVHVANSSET